MSPNATVWFTDVFLMCFWTTMELDGTEKQDILGFEYK